MSILLKALKQAEADRQAARASQPSEPDAGIKASDDADLPGMIEIDPSQTQATIVQHERKRPPLPAFGGLWITLALAVASAAAFGYWMRGISSMNPPSIPATAVQASTGGPDLPVASGPIPPSLMVQEAGPLQLRLDRQLDSLGARMR